MTRFCLLSLVIDASSLGASSLGASSLGKPRASLPRATEDYLHRLVAHGVERALFHLTCRMPAARGARAESQLSELLLVFRRACEKHGLAASLCADAPQFLLDSARVGAVAEQPQHDTGEYLRHRALLLGDMVALCSRLARMGFDAVKPATLVARSAPVANNLSQPVFPRMEVCSWTAYNGVFHPFYQDFALVAQCSHDGIGLDMSAMSWSYANFFAGAPALLARQLRRSHRPLQSASGCLRLAASKANRADWQIRDWRRQNGVMGLSWRRSMLGRLDENHADGVALLARAAQRVKALCGDVDALALGPEIGPGAIEPHIASPVFNHGDIEPIFHASLAKPEHLARLDEAFDAHGFSDQERQQIFYDNAAASLSNPTPFASSDAFPVGANGLCLIPTENEAGAPSP